MKMKKRRRWWWRNSVKCGDVAAIQSKCDESGGSRSVGRSVGESVGLIGGTQVVMSLGASVPPHHTCTTLTPSTLGPPPTWLWPLLPESDGTNPIWSSLIKSLPPFHVQTRKAATQNFPRRRPLVGCCQLIGGRSRGEVWLVSRPLMRGVIAVVGGNKGICISVDCAMICLLWLSYCISFLYILDFDFYIWCTVSK